MKTLVVFYSRSGTTKKVAQAVSEALNCDIEEIIDTKKRGGVLGYIRSGRDAAMKKLTEISQPKKNPADYDLVIIGTPVWANNMAPAIRTYMVQQMKNFKNLAFFCTFSGSGNKSTLSNLEELCSKKTAAWLEVKTREVIKEKHSEKISQFIKEIETFK